MRNPTRKEIKDAALWAMGTTSFRILWPSLYADVLKVIMEENDDERRTEAHERMENAKAMKEY